MAVDVPETEEIAFTLVTNKKSKKKGKASFLLSFTNSGNKILLISRAPPLPRTGTTQTALKLAVTHSIFAIRAKITFKSTQP